jgi:hypothetical protein
MAAVRIGQTVVGLFESKGYALDACHRLKTEGVPDADVTLAVLHEIGPVPRTSEPELAMLDADPLVLGNVRETFARFIRNGETAVLVRAETDEEAQFATDVMALFTPLAIERLKPRPADDQVDPARRSSTSSAAE